MTTFNYIIGIFQAVGSVAVAASIFWLIKQTRTLSKTYRYNSEWKEKNKAAELSKFYQYNILDKISYIEFVMNRTGALKDVAKIREFNEFTATELQRISGSQTIYDDIIKKITLDKNNDVFILANQLYKDKDISSLLDSLSPELLKNRFFSDLSSLLNSMEYFSMCFTTGIADETVVYQSLHQSFLKCVRMLYWAIAASNKNPKDKLYTHLSALYLKWSYRDAEKERQQNAVISVVETIKK